MEFYTAINIFSAFVILLGFVTAFSGWRSKQRLSFLENNGSVVDGTIIRGEWKLVQKARRVSRTYLLDVTYTPHGIAPMTKTFEVSEKYFRQHTKSDVITNTQVKVLYLPADPFGAIVVGGSPDDTINLPIGIVLSVSGAGLLGACYLSG